MCFERLVAALTVSGDGAGEGPAWTTFAGGVQGLRFRVGDKFAVEYVNELSVPTLVHAHGLTPPQGLDGVPFVDAPPIPPGRSVSYSGLPLPMWI